MKWDLQSNAGNPTKSVLINELIKRVAKYTVKQEFNIDKNMLLQCAGSNITALFPRQISLVLVTALILAAYEEEMSSIMHIDIVERIKSKIQSTIRLIENNLNPIKIVALIVTGSDGNLLIYEIETMNDNGTLTPARGAIDKAAYMTTQVSYSISNYFLSILLINVSLFFTNK